MYCNAGQFEHFFGRSEERNNRLALKLPTDEKEAVLSLLTELGCVLSPLIFTSLTHDRYAKQKSNHIIKFADDSAVVGLITKEDERVNKENVAPLISWCQGNNLNLNTSSESSSSLCPECANMFVDVVVFDKRCETFSNGKGSFQHSNPRSRVIYVTVKILQSRKFNFEGSVTETNSCTIEINLEDVSTRMAVEDDDDDDALELCPPSLSSFNQLGNSGVTCETVFLMPARTASSYLQGTEAISWRRREGSSAETQRWSTPPSQADNVATSVSKVVGSSALESTALQLLWISANVALFWRTYVKYCQNSEYYYVHQMLGVTLCVSRASACTLKLSCSLVLLPVCRTILSLLRGSQKVVGRKARRFLDKSKTFHVTCGLTIICFSVVHVAGHIVNALNFSENYSEDFPVLNAARYRGEDPRMYFFTTVPGITGVLMVLILFLIYSSSTQSMRRSNYDVFWYVHSLYIVFEVLLLFHAAGGLLKYQTNTGEHPPGCIRSNGTFPRLHQNATQPDFSSQSFLENSAKPVPAIHIEPGPAEQNKTVRVCTEEPKFMSHFPEIWLWVSGPLCLYCAERLYRCIQRNKAVTVMAVAIHPCNVIEIKMTKVNFKARPGQYISIYCPRISTFESHPFTLTMCPTSNKATFGIHLKVIGDWTERLHDLLIPDYIHNGEILPIFQQRNFPKLYIDGPFGSPSEDIFSYKVSLCVAGGIGVTPFASVFNTLLDDWKSYKLRRLYFIWVCRDILSFHWFADLLCNLHSKLWEENCPDYLNIHLYLSQASDIQSITGDRYQILNSRLTIGRPQWNILFEDIAKYNKKETIGVFCCGPKGISKVLHKLSNSANLYQTKFEYNKESFS
ncbi:NADPH oxidase 4 [Protopterus annectens]|uniref:NADPH oxidase 4 n=1 Tax=Protopterus annectens TaxID=7888 RepID=UPI001CFAB063|nr:NADPH oxidase 4 [Protopterus annectens]